MPDMSEPPSPKSNPVPAESGRADGATDATLLSALVIPRFLLAEELLLKVHWRL